MILALAIMALVLSALPAAMFLVNLPLFCDHTRTDSPDPSAAAEGDSDPPSVSVLIPARDEEGGIGKCLESVLASKRVTLEVVVLDDDSTDATAEIVGGFCESDDRVRLIHGKPLTTPWNGKQHACKQLSEAAEYDRFVFLDADVRLSDDTLARLCNYQDRTDVGLLSAFPHQTTGTWLERWLIPMMHFILLGYLPFARMRSQCDPSLAAGCGQLFLTTRRAYQAAGTHAAIKASRHDGVKLPRAYRTAGIMTDVTDGTDMAECRMYRGAEEVVRGALKNATEGVASPRLIVPFTILLLGCSLLPLLAFSFSVIGGTPIAMTISTIAMILAHLPRFVAAVRLRQSWFGALCHIPATLTFLALQWVALANQMMGRQIAWRGRTES
jgi:glycosyltransferase involved in cell wall biosynthesis